MNNLFMNVMIANNIMLAQQANIRARAAKAKNSNNVQQQQNSLVSTVPEEIIKPENVATQKQTVTELSDLSFVSTTNDNAALDVTENALIAEPKSEPTEAELFIAELENLENNYQKLVTGENNAIKMCSSYQSPNLNNINSSMAAQAGIWSVQVQKSKLSALATTTQNTIKILNEEKALIEKQTNIQETKKASLSKEVEALKTEIESKTEVVSTLTQTFIDENPEVAAAVQEYEAGEYAKKGITIEQYLSENVETFEISNEFATALQELGETTAQLNQKTQELNAVENNLSNLKEFIQNIDERITAQKKLSTAANNDNLAASSYLAYLNLAKIQLMQAESSKSKHNGKWYNKIKNSAIKVTSKITNTVKSITHEVAGFIDKRLGLEQLSKIAEGYMNFYYIDRFDLKTTAVLNPSELEEKCKTLGKDYIAYTTGNLMMAAVYLTPGLAAQGAVLSSIPTSEVVTRKTDSELIGAVAGFAVGCVGGFYFSNTGNLSGALSEVGNTLSSPSKLVSNTYSYVTSQNGVITVSKGVVDKANTLVNQ